jgi:hypothetical protein
MRISTYALATNPKYANFNPFNWQGLAGQLGTKASKALSTPVGAAKLGAGIGAGVGAINYLGSDDKSIGNLAGQVGGGAALGGAAGYGGSRLKNAWQARKAGQVGNQAMLPATTNASATNVTQTPINNQPFTPNAPKQQAQLPAAQPIQRPQPTQNGVITTPVPANQQTINTTAITVPNASGKTQSGNSQPYSLANPNTQGVGQEQIGTLSQKRRKVQLRNAPAGTYQTNGLPPTVSNNNKAESPFANFKVRRYNGFIY